MLAANALKIVEVPTPTGGKIGVTFAPGKKYRSHTGITHDRDLNADLDTICEWDASALVTLVTSEELAELHIQNLGDEVRARFMEWFHLPIEDVSTPDAAFERAWPEASRRLRALLAADARVLIHCKGGIGRAGMLSARLLVEMGVEPDVAMQRVRSARSPHAIETRSQEKWVRRGADIVDSDPSKTVDSRDRAIGALLGLAVGDAVGTTIEFSPKPSRAVIDDMTGGGPFGLEPGQWTDDTAMALALADSLHAFPDFKAADLMSRFVDWHRTGSYSCTGSCFDIGVTTAASLRRFERTGEPFAGSADPSMAGNGSIMRLAPVSIRHWKDRDLMLRVARDQSRTTHATPEAVEACATLAGVIAAGIAGASVPELAKGSFADAVHGFRVGQPRREVRGSGYVVASLHAALWSVSRTSTFREAILLAANLGEDADTTAAIAGQIAGAVYGASGIPKNWLRRLAWRDRIEETADALFRAGAASELAQ